MRLRKHIYMAGMVFAFAISCKDEDYEPSTVTFYPTLEAVADEPPAGSAGEAITVKMKTSRELPVTSQVNIRITGEGAGYGYSYITSPPMLQPGLVTVTMAEGTTDASFVFTPLNDGVFVPKDYQYEFTIEGTSNAIKSVGQETFRLTVSDDTAPFVSYNFDNCSSTPAGFNERIVTTSDVTTVNTWGCSSYGYPNETTKCAEANAYNKGGAGATNSYLVMSTPISGGDYSQLYIGALVYSRYTGKGEIKFKYSTNYSGSGDPEASGVVWTELAEINGALPAAGSQVWNPVGELIDGFGNNNVYVAIQFTGGTSASSSSWRIDNFEIKGI